MLCKEIKIDNKKMHVTLSALASFEIIARHKGLGVCFGFVLPVMALAGRTFEAFGTLVSALQPKLLYAIVSLGDDS